MIVWIIVAAIGVLIAGLALMPPFPDAPAGLTGAADALIGIIHDALAIAAYFLSPWLLLTIFSVFLAIMAAEPIYHGVMWVLRKIPMLGIK